MDNNEGNIKPQQTGGLKLMTVFIAVLALHVIVIGGFTVYHLLNASTSDQDLTLDKSHKNTKVLSDGSQAGDLPASDTSSADKTTPTSTPPADSASAPPPTTAAPATEIAPAPTTVTDAEPTVVNPTAQTPSGPIQHGPVIDPPETPAPATTIAPVATDNTPDNAALSAEGVPYIVKSGDSLARIARQHHIPLAKLKAANSLSSDLLHIGQKMVIPSRTPVVATTPADSPVAVPTDIPAPAPPLHHLAGKMGTAASGHHFYTVVKGDTLTKIARRFKTTPSAIMTANNLTDAARLSIGKKLRIPAGESRSAAASAPPLGQPAEPESKGGPKGQLANFVPGN